MDVQCYNALLFIFLRLKLLGLNSTSKYIYIYTYIILKNVVAHILAVLIDSLQTGLNKKFVVLNLL